MRRATRCTGVAWSGLGSLSLLSRFMIGSRFPSLSGWAWIQPSLRRTGHYIRVGGQPQLDCSRGCSSVRHAADNPGGVVKATIELQDGPVLDAYQPVFPLAHTGHPVAGPLPAIQDAGHLQETALPEHCERSVRALLNLNGQARVLS